jgi:hypothetical protein
MILLRNYAADPAKVSAREENKEAGSAVGEGEGWGGCKARGIQSLDDHRESTDKSILFSSRS